MHQMSQQAAYAENDEQDLLAAQVTAKQLDIASTRALIRNKLTRVNILCSTPYSTKAEIAEVVKSAQRLLEAL